MGRPRRADTAGGIYHALNRGNARATMFHKPEDYDAFERILAERLERYACHLLAYQLMPNHWQLVLQPTEEGQMSTPHRPARGRRSEFPDRGSGLVGTQLRGGQHCRMLGHKANPDNR